MRVTWLAFAALAALAASSTRAETYAPAPKTSVGFINAADRFWAGEVDLAPCARPDVRRNRFALVTPRFRAATQERHGELVGEILGSPAVVEAVTAAARDCAAAAGEVAPAAVLLTAGAAGFSQFHAAFAACMVRADAAQHLGSMTLWIDSHCNW